MLTIDPHQIPTAKLHSYLLGAVTPRPICFASTVDIEGNVNLSPFSFFNVFSAKPPIMVFSPARRVRDNTTKHTLENVQQVAEVVVNIVSYDMVQQMSLASAEYDKGVNEFVKAGFTEVPSDLVKPPRVKESPVQFECKVNEVIALGEEGGAGHLVICEVVRLHIKEDILDATGVIDPALIDTVARMGGNWYTRSRSGIFEVPKPVRTLGVGIDALPEVIRSSKIFSGNDLGMLANVQSLPAGSEKIDQLEEEDQLKAREALKMGDVPTAWSILTKNIN